MPPNILSFCYPAKPSKAFAVSSPGLYVNCGQSNYTISLPAFIRSSKLAIFNKFSFDFTLCQNALRIRLKDLFSWLTWIWDFIEIVILQGFSWIIYFKLWTNLSTYGHKEGNNLLFYFSIQAVILPIKTLFLPWHSTYSYI